MNIFEFVILIFIISGCAKLNIDNQFKKTTLEKIPFDFISEHFVSLPIKVNGTDSKKFIFDTGIGINLISHKICESHNCKPVGRFTGKRMSGQEVSAELVEIDSVSLGNFKVSNFVAGVFDIDALMPGEDIGGFISIGFFKDQVISIDYAKKTLTFESNESLKEVKNLGISTPITLHKDGPSTGITMRFVLPNQETVSVELDTGSQALILHEKYMKRLGFSPSDSRIKVREGMDETGNSYKRYFSKLDGLTHIPQSSKIGVKNLNVMFQKIIYDGLMGQFFLKPFLITYDLKHSEIIFRKYD